jgi:ComF family protein
MLRTLFYSIINAIIPPRAREAAVLGLSLDDLEALRHRGGLPYHDPRVTSLVWELKYRAHPRAVALAGAFLSEELMDIAGEELGKSLLIPVPMHPERRRERGHNQTELLCEAALAHLRGSYEYAPNALERTARTAPQQTLARSKRLNNVRDSMRAGDPARVRGRACVVVDDVATTGATLKEAERALMRAGARKVYTLALAIS